MNGRPKTQFRCERPVTPCLRRQVIEHFLDGRDGLNTQEKATLRDQQIMSQNPISLMRVLTDQIHRTTTNASTFWTWWLGVGMARRWGCFRCPVTNGRRFSGWTIPEMVHVRPHQTQGLAINKTRQPTKTYGRRRQASYQGFAWIPSVHFQKITSTAQLFPSFLLQYEWSQNYSGRSSCSTIAL